MAKVTIDTALTDYGATKLNSNFQTLVNELNNKVLYRDNPTGEPNSMKSDLDMDGKRVYNLPAPTAPNEAARLKDVQDAIAGVATASTTSFSPAGTLSATTVQGALQELDTEKVPVLTFDSLLKNQIAAVVSSLTALRGLDKNKYTKACTTGYYAEGDGGGGIYYLDSADTTSTDNSVTVIVASDGGRWKLTQSFPVSVKQAGAKGDGTTNDYPALDAALNWLSSIGGGVLYFPAGTYLISSSFVLPANVTLLGAGKKVSIIKRNVASVLITQMGAHSGLEHLAIDGNGSAFDIVTVTGGSSVNYQSMRFCRLHNTSTHALSFAADSGVEFRAIGCEFMTTGTLGTVAAVKVTGTDTAACPRHFTNCAGEGSTLFDFGGCNDLFVTGGYTNGLIFGSASSKVMIANLRVGAAGGTQTISGSNHTITNCVFATAVTLTCTDSIFNCIVPDWNITDNGTGNSVFQRLRQYTPTWTASTTNPSIGNGSVTGYFSRQGSKITVQLDIRFGSTTSFGSGSWRFSVPRVDANPYAVIQVVGSGFTQGSGAKDFAVIPRIHSGNGYIELFYIDTAGVLQQIGSATQAWSTSGNLRLSFEYLTT